MKWIILFLPKNKKQKKKPKIRREVFTEHLMEVYNYKYIREMKKQSLSVYKSIFFRESNNAELGIQDFSRKLCQSAFYLKLRRMENIFITKWRMQT